MDKAKRNMRNVSRVFPQRETRTRETYQSCPPSAASSFPSVGVKSHQGSLEDTQLWELAQRITSEQELLDLGLKVLQLPEYKINSSLYNKGDIELAAHETLKTWMKNQESPKEAYQNLYRGLSNHGWRQLANELLPQISDKPTSTQSRTPYPEPETIPSSVLEITKPPVPFEVNVVVHSLTDTTASKTDVLQQTASPSTDSTTAVSLTTVQKAPAADERSVASSSPESLLPERLSYIRSCLEKSLITRFDNFMSIDWLPLDKTRRFSGYVYTEPCWTRTIKGNLQDRQVPMRRLCDIFTEYKENSRVLAEGVAGSGKSSAAAKLALDWTGNEESEDDQESHEQTNILREKFDFVFIVLLKDIDCEIPLEKVIIQEHDLVDKHITENEIKTILESSKCLLIFDGYDEYKKDTNSAIDAAIGDKRGNSFVLITSRPDHMDNEDRKKLDGKIQIRGLSDESITKCVDRYFENEAVSQPVSPKDDTKQAKFISEDLLTKAKKQSVFRLLKIPILLLMLSVLYVDTGSLPERRADIMWEIIQIYIKRAKEKGIEFEDPDVLLCHLGELSYDASQRDKNKLKIEKKAVNRKCGDILKLGLLQGDMTPERAHTGIRQQPEWLQFPHKIFNDYVIAHYIAKQKEDGINLIFYNWLHFCRKPWRFKRQLKVDTDVLRFVLELTDILWLYRLLGIRRWIFWGDRQIDIIAFILFTVYYFNFDPRWNIFLVIYITLRVVSLTLCYNTKLWKCHAVRAFLSIVSGLCCIVTVFGLSLLNQGDEIRYTVPVIGVLSMCALYVLVLKHKQLMLGETEDQLPHKMKGICNFYRYHLTRKVLMYVYGFCIFVAFNAFLAYWLDSAPFWDVCLGIYITFLLISLLLYSNAKLCTPCTARTLVKLITPFVICNIPLWVPYFLGTLHDTLFIVLPIFFSYICCIYWSLYF